MGWIQPPRSGVARPTKSRFRRSRIGAARRPLPLLLAAILSAEIVIGAGIATDWFWFGPASGSSAPGGGGKPGPNPNPYNETILGVWAGISYTGAMSGYFIALQGKEICGHCPAIPFTDYNFSPPVAGFWFYFNVTSNATTYETISNFTVATSGANPELFSPGFVSCCYPSYESTTARVGFTPSETVGLAAFVHAASIPDVGPSGFVLYFNVTSP
ncbi:MAG TPA: hypothetical protein VK455_00375 [Thermoplasmata archaeon]|nr:hypothetical protein [Thermoplasmata archaeon]